MLPAAMPQAGHKVRKTSRRDLPLVMALKLDGATTVSATMLLAARAGIQVFVTGGACGGLHLCRNSGAVTTGFPGAALQGGV